MKKSSFFKYILTFFVILTWLSFLTAFSSNFFVQWIKQINFLSDNIYPNSKSLNKTYFIYKSNFDLSNTYFQSSCETKTNVEKNWDLYLIELEITNPKCSNNMFILKSNFWILDEIKLNLVSDSSLYNTLLDINSPELTNLSSTMDSFIKKYSVYADYKNDPLNDVYNYSRKKRIHEELVYRNKIIQNILQKRQEKYIIPIKWYNLPETSFTKMPNSWRPYRSKLTDWIHHSWDIDTSFWKEVLSLDDWIVIRIVNNWNDIDLLNLRKWEKISDEDKMRNLDIYRWNQIWIKTMKWELVMYAHLDKVLEWLKEWDFVNKWDYIWNVWVTWVPQADYKDYHLDFWIYENPFDSTKTWNYEITDYMKWDRKFKWKDMNFIKQNQYEIFEKNDKE